MLPFLQREIVDKLHWIEGQELLDLYALAQCTPGIIAVNTATYIGYKKRKISGACVATLGIVLPPLAAILLVSILFAQALQGETAHHILTGVRVGVCALISNTLVDLWKKSVKDKLTFALCICAFIVATVWRPSPVYMTVFSTLLGGVVLAGMEKENL